jgi:hypothetical protein
MKITMVKKLFADGSPCKKCGEVEEKMRAAGHLERLDRVVIADEADPASEGMVLAALHTVDRAPFFIVERDGQPQRSTRCTSNLLKKCSCSDQRDDEIRES